MTASDSPLQPSTDSLEREIALVEDLLAAHLQREHSGVLGSSLQWCAVCQALDNRRQQVIFQWLDAERGRPRYSVKATLCRRKPADQPEQV